MASPNTAEHIKAESQAIPIVADALANLPAESQRRVIDYVTKALGLNLDTQPRDHRQDNRGRQIPPPVEEEEAPEDEALEGISPTAKMWLKRNGLSDESLTKLFSLGVDEIDLVASNVPGRTKKDRMRSVFLLRGVASLLSTGAPKFSHEDAKRACLDYDVWDSTNSTSYIQSMATEVSGTAKTGYALTAGGLRSAAELIKGIIGAKD